MPAPIAEIVDSDTRKLLRALSSFLARKANEESKSSQSQRRSEGDGEGKISRVVSR